MEHATLNYRVLWSNIESCLDLRHAHWRERVEEFGQVRAVQQRSRGLVWSDDQVFEAILRAVLSSNTVWSRVERVLADLSELFDSFSLEKYASYSDTTIDSRFVPWFKVRRAGSVSLRGGLLNLARAARILLRHSQRHGSADHYFTSLVHRCVGDAKQAAMRLGGQGEYKLPSLGVALAAEALKNLGFDVAKPDRHVMRALGSFGLVQFNRWTHTPGGREPPRSPSGQKLLKVMTVAEQIVEAAERPVVFVDNAIWLLCARDELHLTNSKLSRIADEAGLPDVPTKALGEDRRSGSKRPRNGTTAIRVFHEIYGNVHELPDRGAFPHERDLQDFFEKHLRTLTGVEFLASEYSAGARDSRRIDTLGVDGAGRPVVIEYRRRRDENFIDRGLGSMACLEDQQAEFRELVREKLGVGRSMGIDFGTPRLLCVADEFSHLDRVTAESSRRRVELLRYRRYSDAYVAVECVHGGEAIDPPPEPVGPPPRITREKRTSIAPRLSRSSAPGAGEDPDYTVYETWVKASEESRTLFWDLKTLVDQLGSVRTDAAKTVISLKCMAAPGHRPPVLAYVYLTVRTGLRVLVHEKHVCHIPFEDGFTRPNDGGKYRQIVIRDRNQIRKAEPLLHAAYDSLSNPGS